MMVGELPNPKRASEAGHVTGVTGNHVDPDPNNGRGRAPCSSGGMPIARNGVLALKFQGRYWTRPPRGFSKRIHYFRAAVYGI
jgi:hypothetical protein